MFIRLRGFTIHIILFVCEMYLIYVSIKALVHNTAPGLVSYV